MNSIRPLAVVLRLLAPDSPSRAPQHPLHPFHVPPTRAPAELRSPPPFTVNRFARIGVPLELDYWTVQGEEAEQAIHWHSVPHTPEPWHDVTLAAHAPLWAPVVAAVALLDPSRPWEVQDTLTDPRLYGLDEDQCVLWLVSLGGTRGKGTPRLPSLLKPHDRHVVALVVNNSAAHSDTLIDVPASVARSGGEPADEAAVRAVVERLHRWLAVLFRGPPAPRAPSAGPAEPAPDPYPSQRGRPPSAALVEARKAAASTQARLALVSGRIQAAAVELDAENPHAAAFLRGLLDPVDPAAPTDDQGAAP